MYVQRRKTPRQATYANYQPALRAATQTLAYAPPAAQYRAKAPAMMKRRKPMPARRPTVVRGVGAYKKTTPKKYKSSGIFSKVGGVLGSALGTFVSPGAGTAIGGVLGSAAGSLLSQITGLGSYQISNNSLLSEGNQPPKVSNSPDSKSFIIKHREYLMDVVTSSSANTFKVDKFNVNPGDSSTFPYLANIACNFQEWVPRGIIFEFESTSSEAIASGTNTALGSVTMASNYESEQVEFSSLPVMLNTEYTCTGKPSQNIMHPIECAPSQNVFMNGYFVSNGTDTVDTRELQPCEFYIATSGFQGTSVTVGRLWISYEIHLRKPVGTALLGTCVKSYSFGSNDYSNAQPMYVTQDLNYNNTPITSTSNTINFNNLSAGCYLINLQWFGSAVNITYPGVSINSSLQQKTVNGAILLLSPAAGVNSTNASMQFYIKVIDRNGVITLTTGGVLPTGARYSLIDIVQIPNAYYDSL